VPTFSAQTPDVARRPDAEALAQWRLRWLRAMMAGSSNASLTVAISLGHFMHIKDPPLVRPIPGLEYPGRVSVDCANLNANPS